MGDNSPPAPASPANRRVVWLVSIAVVLVLLVAYLELKVTSISVSIPWSSAALYPQI